MKRWLSWIVFAGLLYFMSPHLLPPSMPKPPAPITARDAPSSAPASDARPAGAALQQLLSAEQWRQRLRPQAAPACHYLQWRDARAHQPPVRIQTIREGAGPPAHCGDTLTIAIRRRAHDGTGETGLSRTWTLGNPENLPALDAAIDGMKPGARREVALPLAAYQKDARAAALRDQPAADHPPLRLILTR